MPNYEDYLEHFFEKAETSIREGKGNQLSDNLSHLAELIQGLIIKEQVSEGQFRSDYKFCKRRYVRLYKQILDDDADEDLRVSVIRSISAVANYASKSNDLVAYQQLLNALKNATKTHTQNQGSTTQQRKFLKDTRHNESAQHRSSKTPTT